MNRVKRKASISSEHSRLQIRRRIRENLFHKHHNDENDIDDNNNLKTKRKRLQKLRNRMRLRDRDGNKYQRSEKHDDDESDVDDNWGDVGDMDAFKRSVMVQSLQPFSASDFSSSDYTTELFQKHDLESVKNERNLMEERHQKVANMLQSATFQHYPLFIKASKEISGMDADMLRFGGLLNEFKTVFDNLESTELYTANSNINPNYVTDSSEDENAVSSADYIDETESDESSLLDSKDSSSERRTSRAFRNPMSYFSAFHHHSHHNPRYSQTSRQNNTTQSTSSNNNSRQSVYSRSGFNQRYSLSSETSSISSKLFDPSPTEHSQQFEDHDMTFRTRMTKHNNRKKDFESNYYSNIDESSPFFSSNSPHFDDYNHFSSSPTTSTHFEFPEMSKQIESLESDSRYPQVVWELDVALAERNWTQAIESTRSCSTLLEQTKMCYEYQSQPNTHLTERIDEIQTRLETLRRSIIRELLSADLSKEQTHQMVRYLGMLDHEEEAIEIFLASRTRWLHSMEHSVEFKGSIADFSREISKLYFQTFLQTFKEFKSLFGVKTISSRQRNSSSPSRFTGSSSNRPRSPSTPLEVKKETFNDNNNNNNNFSNNNNNNNNGNNNNSNMSAFMEWVIKQLDHLAALYRNHVFVYTDTFQTIFECISAAYEESERLTPEGLYLTFHLKQLFKDDLMVALNQYFDDIDDVLSKSCSTEKWNGREVRLADIFSSVYPSEKMNSGKLESLKDTSLILSDSGIQIYYLTIKIIYDITPISSITLYPTIVNYIDTMLQNYLNVLNINSKNQLNDMQFLSIISNAANIVQELIPLAQKDLKKLFNREIPELTQLLDQYNHLDETICTAFCEQRSQAIVTSRLPFSNIHYPQRYSGSSKISSPFIKFMEFLNKLSVSVSMFLAPEYVVPIIGLLLDDIVTKLDDFHDFWDRFEVSCDSYTKDDVNQLVLDLRFFETVCHNFLSETSQFLISKMKEKIINTYAQYHFNGDTQKVLHNETWFDTTLQRVLSHEPMSKVISELEHWVQQQAQETA